jgi:hypothetical protein
MTKKTFSAKKIKLKKNSIKKEEISNIYSKKNKITKSAKKVEEKVKPAKKVEEKVKPAKKVDEKVNPAKKVEDTQKNTDSNLIERIKARLEKRKEEEMKIKTESIPQEKYSELEKFAIENKLENLYFDLKKLTDAQINFFLEKISKKSEENNLQLSKITISSPHQPEFIDALKEEIFSQFKGELEDLSKDIGSIRKKGNPLFFESLELQKAFLKLKFFKATESEKELKIVKNILSKIKEVTQKIIKKLENEE